MAKYALLLLLVVIGIVLLKRSFVFTRYTFDDAARARFLAMCARMEQHRWKQRAYCAIVAILLLGVFVSLDLCYAFLRFDLQAVAITGGDVLIKIAAYLIAFVVLYQILMRETLHMHIKVYMILCCEEQKKSLEDAANKD